MQYFNHTNPKMLIADEGKLLREINDIYVKEHTDEQGNKIEEHIPYRTTTIFLPDNISEDDARNMYVEEDITNEN